MLSVSVSESTPSPSSSDKTLPIAVVVVSSVTEAELSVAIGVVLATFQINESETVPPFPSSAVTVTVNGPLVEAEESMVPVINPAGLMVNPVGKPIALKVSVSFSMSLKLPLTSILIVSLSMLA